MSLQSKEFGCQFEKIIIKIHAVFITIPITKGVQISALSRKKILTMDLR
jgi:hypothetical protein